MKNVKRYTYFNINDTTLPSRQFMRHEGNFLESYYHVYTVSLNQKNITLRNVCISKKKLISKGPITNYLMADSTIYICLKGFSPQIFYPTIAGGV